MRLTLKAHTSGAAPSQGHEAGGAGGETTGSPWPPSRRHRLEVTATCLLGSQTRGVEGAAVSRQCRAHTFPEPSARNPDLCRSPCRAARGSPRSVQSGGSAADPEVPRALLPSGVDVVSLRQSAEKAPFATAPGGEGQEGLQGPACPRPRPREPGGDQSKGHWGGDRRRAGKKVTRRRERRIFMCQVLACKLPAIKEAAGSPWDVRHF